jgi:hypothetical protein
VIALVQPDRSAAVGAALAATGAVIRSVTLVPAGVAVQGDA